MPQSMDAVLVHKPVNTVMNHGSLSCSFWEEYQINWYKYILTNMKNKIG